MAQPSQSQATPVVRLGINLAAIIIAITVIDFLTGRYGLHGPQ